MHLRRWEPNWPDFPKMQTTDSEAERLAATSILSIVAKAKMWDRYWRMERSWGCTFAKPTKLWSIKLSRPTRKPVMESSKREKKWSSPSHSLWTIWMRNLWSRKRQRIRNQLSNPLIRQNLCQHEQQSRWIHLLTFGELEACFPPKFGVGSSRRTCPK